MAWLVVAGVIVLPFVCGLTGEFVQTGVLHNTTPIAQRGAASDFVIGGVIWLVIVAIVLAIRWRMKENKNLAEQARNIHRGGKE